MLSKELIEKVMYHDGEFVIVSRLLEVAFEELRFSLKRLPPTEGTLAIQSNNDPYSYSRNWGGFPKLNRKQLLAIIDWIAREQKEERRRLLIEEGKVASFLEDLAIYFVPRDKEGCKYPYHHDSATRYNDSPIPIYDKGWEKAHSEDTCALKWGVRSAEVERKNESRKELAEKYRILFYGKVYELFYFAGEGYWLSTNDNDFLLYTEDDVTRRVQEELGSFEDFVEFNYMEPWQKKLKSLL